LVREEVRVRISVGRRKLAVMVVWARRMVGRNQNGSCEIERIGTGYVLEIDRGGRNRLFWREIVTR